LNVENCKLQIGQCITSFPRSAWKRGDFQFLIGLLGLALLAGCDRAQDLTATSSVAPTSAAA
jgi:hypothetical protein